MRTKPPSRPRARRRGHPGLWRMLLRDRLATVAAAVLLVMLLVSLIGPLFAHDVAQRQDFGNALQPAFHTTHGWWYVLGADNLGRSLLADTIVGGRTTFSVAIPTVVIAMAVGSFLGIVGGYLGGWVETIVMRIADIVMSFPSLLLAVVVLFVFKPSIFNMILVLSVTRIPVYVRTARAETSELRSRVFVDAARTFSASKPAIIRRHVVPIVLPTLFTVAAVDFCYVMLAESSLDFLGIGVQPPQMSWGLLVAEGRQYIQSAWWLSFFPGLAIVLTAISATVLASWTRIATDPGQRWRLSVRRGLVRTATPPAGVRVPDPTTEGETA